MTTTQKFPSLGGEITSTGDAGEVGPPVPGHLGTPRCCSVCCRHMLQWRGLTVRPIVAATWYKLAASGGGQTATTVVSGHVGASTLANGDHRVGHLLLIRLQRHVVFGLQVVLDDVPLALHGARAEGAVKDARLHLARPIFGLVLGARQLVHRVQVVAAGLNRKLMSCSQGQDLGQLANLAPNWLQESKQPIRSQKNSIDTNS